MREIIASKIKKTFETYQLTIPYTIEEKSLNHYQSYAAFNCEKNRIYFRKDGILQEWRKTKRMDLNFSFKEFMEIIILHEAGHAMDGEIHTFHQKKKTLIQSFSAVKDESEANQTIEELGALILKSESNAWNYAERYIRSTHDYQTYKRYCIDAYVQYLSVLHAQLLKIVS